jgi:hypothetical protein
MKRMLVATLVLALAVTAQAGIVSTVSFVSTVTVGTAAGDKIVDVYKVTQTATGTDPNTPESGYNVGAIGIGIGNDGGTYATNLGVNPLQIWNDGYDPSDEFSDITTFWTVTYNQTGVISTAGDYGSNRLADTRFLPVGMNNWSPVAVSARETNSEALGLIPNGGGDIAGQGWIGAAVGVPVANRTHSKDVIQVGVLRGTEVWGRLYSADDAGVVTDETVLIPEPATLSILGLGALALIRRRR